MKEELKERLSQVALYQTDGLPIREVLVVFYHCFSRWTWYVVEAEEQEDGDYVFPFINSNMSELEIKNTIFGINNKVSTQLKTFAKKYNIKKSPSTTYARHSFATNMRCMGVPSEYIEYAMGHAIKGVAGNYFGGYPFETIVKYNSMLLNSHDLQLKAVS